MNTIVGKEIYFDERLSTIIKLQTEITRALIHGHKATMDDVYQGHREQIHRLRGELGIGKLSAGQPMGTQGN